MVEKKEVAKAATKRTTTKKACAKKVTVKVDLGSENVGFKAGDVYNALAAENKGLTVSEIAKAAKITVEETYLGIGWLLKEGKINSEDDKIVLA
ncbi:MAG: winged helix-turn-helix domain-containing protein [Prevotella intermedia]